MSRTKTLRIGWLCPIVNGYEILAGLVAGRMSTRTGRLFQGRPVLLALLATLLLTLSAPFGHADPVFPPGGRWGLEPPPGFALKDGMMFEHPSGAIITIASSAKPHDPSTFSPVGTVLPRRGSDPMRVEAIEQLTVAGMPATFMTLRSVKDAAQVLVFAPQGETAGLITALVPDATSPQDMAVIRAALLTARERPLDTRQQLDALPVRVAGIDGMRIAGTVGNLVVILTDGPEATNAAGPQQTFVTLAAVPTDTPAWNPGVEQRFSAHIEERLPGSRSLSARVRTLGDRPVAEVLFERRRNDQLRQGAAFLWVVGNHNLMLVLEAPVGQPADVSRMERLLAGIAPK